MNPSHYVSLPLAKRMKEVGFEQESEYYISSAGNIHTWDEWSDIGENTIIGPLYHCYSVAELGEMLPYYASSEKHSNDWRVGIIKKGVTELWGSADTEADARANALIYLKEQGII